MEPVKNLSAAAVNVETRSRDWSKGYGEEDTSQSWEYWEAVECSECGKMVVGARGEDRHCDVDHESSCDGYLCAEGHMMNYSYALPGFGMNAEEAARLIADLPLCLVQFTQEDDDEEWALALTGGGMDLTWYIVEAYMRLGYLPPVDKCRMPDYSRHTYTRRRKWILADCARSLRVVRDQLNYRLCDLGHTRARLKAESTRQKEKQVA